MVTYWCLWLYILNRYSKAILQVRVLAVYLLLRRGVLALEAPTFIKTNNFSGQLPVLDSAIPLQRHSERWAILTLQLLIDVCGYFGLLRAESLPKLETSSAYRLRFKRDILRLWTCTSVLSCLLQDPLFVLEVSHGWLWLMRWLSLDDSVWHLSLSPVCGWLFILISLSNWKKLLCMSRCRDTARTCSFQPPLLMLVALWVVKVWVILGPHRCAFLLDYHRRVLGWSNTMQINCLRFHH